MESLLNGLGIDPDAKSKGKGRDGGNSGGADRERLAAAWEAMLVEGMNTTVEPSNARASSSADASSPGTTGHDFQSSIRSTLNRLKESESGLQPSDASASAGGENLESLLAQLKDLGNVGEGANSEEHLQGVLEEMMGQLMGKDVLYEPLKELHEKVRMQLRLTSNPSFTWHSSLGISPSTPALFRLRTRHATRHK